MNTPPICNEGDFKDRVAIVTGGTRGLGRHLSKTLVSLGCHVYFCGRDADTGHALAEDWGELAHFVQCDLSDPDATRRFVEQAGEFRGEIDYFVNNAAIDPVVPFEECSLEEFDEVIAVDLRACFVSVKAALPFLKVGSGKAVVVIGTTNWMIGHRHYTMYAAAKSGLVGLTRALAHDLGADGIRVNMVSPGWIMTERQLAERVTAEDRLKLLQETAIAEVLEDHHVTPATIFLLSPSAGGISGQNLVVDGGKYMY